MRARRSSRCSSARQSRHGGGSRPCTRRRRPRSRSPPCWVSFSTARPRRRPTLPTGRRRGRSRRRATWAGCCRSKLCSTRRCGSWRSTTSRSRWCGRASRTGRTCCSARRRGCRSPPPRAVSSSWSWEGLLARSSRVPSPTGSSRGGAALSSASAPCSSRPPSPPSPPPTRHSLSRPATCASASSPSPCTFSSASSAAKSSHRG
mmetsp:Transcript_34327/g.58781  ORF Transcript_34327/g.58781 Transcript_34327/m.58781 type:complete len:204 (+) Transcript_34327:656-1267(+)